MITFEQYIGGYDKKFPGEFTEIIRKNAVHTIDMSNWLLAEAQLDRSSNSGWRPRIINAATPGAAKNSLHITA